MRLDTMKAMLERQLETYRAEQKALEVGLQFPAIRLEKYLSPEILVYNNIDLPM